MCTISYFMFSKIFRSLFYGPKTQTCHFEVCHTVDDKEVCAEAFPAIMYM